MGSEGSIYASQEGIYRVYPLNLEVKNTVGAGDAMVAGLIHGMSKGLQAEKLAALGLPFQPVKLWMTLADWRSFRNK